MIRNQQHATEMRTIRSRPSMDETAHTKEPPMISADSFTAIVVGNGIPVIRDGK